MKRKMQYYVLQLSNMKHLLLSVMQSKILHGLMLNAELVDAMSCDVKNLNFSVWQIHFD